MNCRRHDRGIEKMCGRFTITLSADELASAFSVSKVEDFTPRYNVAPTQTIPVIVRDTERDARIMLFMRWGLVPHWAKNLSFGAHRINAQAETVDIKPSFRSAFKHRRCLIPTTGFYEWDKSQDVHQPYLIGMKDGSPFALAGLWETWRDENEHEIKSCTIITTGTNNLISRLHDRMPVILDTEQYDSWLDTENLEGESLKPLLVPYPADAMQMYPVSTDVNDAQHEGKALIRRIH